MTRAVHALGRLHQAARQVPNAALLRRPTLRREAQSTSALEGTFAPLTEVLAADVVDPVHRSGEVREVLNFVASAEAAFAWVAEGRPLTPSLLGELHRILVTGTAADNEQAGRVRGIQVAIGSPTQGIRDARFVPPPPGTHLEAAVHDLLTWMRPSPVESRDRVVAAAVAHYQFEALHPFNDGNGRLGRLLVVVQLLQDGLLAEPLLSVSPWFEARRNEYQDRLAAVSATGDWDSWVAFFADGLAASAADTAHRVDRLLDIQSVYVERVRQARIAGIARDLAEGLVGSPYITVSAAAALTGRTFQAANSAVRRLTELGILREVTGRSQDRLFEASAVVQTLTAPPRTWDAG